TTIASSTTHSFTTSPAIKTPTTPPTSIITIIIIIILILIIKHPSVAWTAIATFTVFFSPVTRPTQSTDNAPSQKNHAYKFLKFGSHGSVFTKYVAQGSVLSLASIGVIPPLYIAKQS
ncbi:hypothetical protein TorRG33x02_216100, partial [Trema orientale]